MLSITPDYVTTMLSRGPVPHQLTVIEELFKICLGLLQDAACSPQKYSTKDSQDTRTSTELLVDHLINILVPGWFESLEQYPQGMAVTDNIAVCLLYSSFFLEDSPERYLERREKLLRTSDLIAEADRRFTRDGEKKDYPRPSPSLEGLSRERLLELRKTGDPEAEKALTRLDLRDNL